MSDLMSILKSAINEEALASMAQQIGATPQATRGAVNTALPVVVGMLANQCQSKQGCESLAQAVEKAHDGSILGQVQGFLQGGNLSQGERILGHLMGAKQAPAEQALAAQTGLASGQAHQLLALLAPIVMGAMGQQARASGGASANNMGAIAQAALGSVMGGSGGSAGSQILGSLLGGSGGSKAGLAQAGASLLGGFLKK
ncbi:MAG: DUF937 domain-containing protein [Wenzhouxiangella sp.]